MKKLALLAATLSLALPAAARGINVRVHRGGQDQDRAVVSLGKSVVVKPGQTVEDVVVIGASADIQGTVEGSVVIIGGHVEVDGSIEEDLVSIGSAHLGPKAVIEGDAVAIGGALEAEPGAVVRGDRVALSLPGAVHLGAAGEWLSKGLLWGRPLPHQYPWAWAAALALLLTNLLLAAVLAKPVAICESQIEERPASTFLAGALGLVLIGPVIITLLVSVVGLLAVPFLLCAAVAAVWLGKIAVWRHIGGRLGISRPLPAVAAGGAVLLTLYAVPVLGLATWNVATAMGLGAALLSLLSALRRESGQETPPQASPAPVEATADAALPRAGFWLRAAATALDAIFFIIIGGVTGIAYLGLAGWALYQVAFWSWKGTTVGGIIVGIHGVRVDGRPMDFSVALIRHLASYFSAAACLLGFLWAAWDPEKQSWHDKIAGTFVVRTPRGRSLI